MNERDESIKFHLVDIKDVESEVTRSTFDEGAIEKLAEIIVATGCLLKPLVLKQVAPMKYQVLEGHFEYYAAVSANKRDTQRVLSGMVSAFVVKSEIETVAIQQAQMLNKTISTTEIKTVSTSSSSSESRINDLESRLERELQEIKAVQVQILEVLKSKELESVSKPTASAIPQHSREEVESEVLNALNTWDINRLVTKLQIVKGIKTKATNIAENLVAKRPFKDWNDVVERVNGIAEKIKENIIAAWMKQM